ncbi:MAG: hypothetical protein AB7P04_10655 [Bacteriovoracia bacterium]
MSKIRQISLRTALLFLLLLTIIYAAFRSISDRSSEVIGWFGTRSSPEVLILSGSRMLCDVAAEKIKAMSPAEKQKLLPFFTAGENWTLKDFDQKFHRPWWLDYLLIGVDEATGTGQTTGYLAMNCFDRAAAEMAPVGLNELFRRSFENVLRPGGSNREYHYLQNRFVEVAPEACATVLVELLDSGKYQNMESILLTQLVKAGPPGFAWAAAQLKSLAPYVETEAAGNPPFPNGGPLVGDFARHQTLVSFFMTWGAAVYTDKDRAAFQDFLDQRSPSEQIFVIRHVAGAANSPKEKLQPLANLAAKLTESTTPAIREAALRILKLPAFNRGDMPELVVPRLQRLFNEFNGADIAGLRVVEEITRTLEGLRTQSTSSPVYLLLKPHLELFLKRFFKAADPSLEINQRFMGAVASGPHGDAFLPTFTELLKNPRWRKTALKAAPHFPKSQPALIQALVIGFPKYTVEERTYALGTIQSLAIRYPNRPSDVLDMKSLDLIFGATAPEDDQSTLQAYLQLASSLGDLFLVYARDWVKRKTRPDTSILVLYAWSRRTPLAEDFVPTLLKWRATNRPRCDQALKNLYNYFAYNSERRPTAEKIRAGMESCLPPPQTDPLTEDAHLQADDHED